MAGRINGSHSVSVAVFVFVAGLLVSFVAWFAFRNHERSDVQGATRRAAEAIGVNLVNNLEWEVVGLDRLAMLWRAADPPQPLWTKNAELYIQHRPGCVAVEWLNPDRDKRDVITAGGLQRPLVFDGVPEKLISAVTRSKNAMMSAPEVAADGRQQWAVAYPVFDRGRMRGFIVTFFDLEKTLNYALGGFRDLGFSFAVSLPNHTEYAPPGTSRKHEQDWGTILEVPLSGVTWQLRVWPDKRIINEIQSWLPGLILAGGCVLSLLLALSLYFAVRLAHSSDVTRLANEVLQQEIRRREGAQEELRKAHAGLEMRIDRRSAELASANTLLRKEVAEHKHTEELLRDLTGRLFHLQDDERKRLARELHDGAAQNLVALSMNLGMIRNAVSAQDINTKEVVNESVCLVEEATKELRTISYLLHPPYFDELGLGPALCDFVDGFATRSGIKVSLDLDPKLGRLGHHLELGIFRVVQEALSNIHRHAHSRTASIVLVGDTDVVRLEIADAGCGIPPEILAPSGGRLAGVGIVGMQERVRLLGGKLEIQSSDAGTRIQAVIPLLGSSFTLSEASVLTVNANHGHDPTPAAEAAN